MSTPRPTLTSSDVVAAVRRRYGAEKDGLGPEWAALDEFSLATGTGRQRADLFLVRAWPGLPKGHERHAIEVKVSRSDLRTELARPEKAAVFEAVAHRFYLAVPAGLLRESDVLPARWGVYEVTADGTRCRKIKEAARFDPDPLPEGALVEAFRRAARTESRIREADLDLADDPAAMIARMRAEQAAATRSEYTARSAAQRDKHRLQRLLALIGEAGGWRCVCGKAIKVADYRVEHLDKSACERGRWGSAELDHPSTTDLAARLGLLPPICEATGEELLPATR